MSEVKERRPLATTEEVANYLQVSVPALHQLRHVGRAPKAAKVGRGLRWKWSDVDEWLESRAS
ncbi:helix-turn-helix transcriptional regulator [Micromonospora zamorensis]|uniref:helix-turn-helix transcriptional regulator n=1 Tax=Micromonospora zamorensis TaxID=709883 RepID=UPI0036871254